MLTSEEIRKIYKKFWESEPRNFKEVPNVSLVPNNDPTLLFVNSGMFPLNPYLSGEPHALGTRLFNIQRCLRTPYDEMIEIGDNRHTLMFEMMGDWSLGDFSKAEEILWIMELYIEHLGLDPNRLYVSVWGGDENVPLDQEAVDTWKIAFAKYGIKAEFSDDITNIPQNIEEGKSWEYRIFPYGRKKNWWQRAESIPGELGGPSSEHFYDTGVIERKQDKYHINDDSGRFIEIGNSVFMEYRFTENGKWEEMQQKNIDYGGGFERIVMCSQGKVDIFETDLFLPIIKKIEEISGKNYKEKAEQTEFTRYFRILADHSRAATFILGDGILPSNKDQGYILRRFIRRLVRYGVLLGIEGNFAAKLAEAVIEKMKVPYTHLYENKAIILAEMDREESKFKTTLQKGLKELSSIKEELRKSGLEITGEKAFYIYETYGFPLEMTLDELEIVDEKAKAIQKDFDLAQQKHREESRGNLQKFKGGLADQARETTKLHTTQHLLLKALQIVLDGNIRQKGSNITSERLRLDFNFDRKLTEEEIRQVEKIVNEQIERSLPICRDEINKEIVENENATFIQKEFGQKYPDVVSVYSVGLEKPVCIGEDGKKLSQKEILEKYKGAYCVELCGGPHVRNTKDIGEGGKRFKIMKQENIGAGLKRIKAGLE